MQKELQERAKYEITGTRVLRQKLKRRFRVVGKACDQSLCIVKLEFMFSLFKTCIQLFGINLEKSLLCKIVFVL